MAASLKKLRSLKKSQLLIELPCIRLTNLKFAERIKPNFSFKTFILPPNLCPFDSAARGGRATRPRPPTTAPLTLEVILIPASHTQATQISTLMKNVTHLWQGAEENCPVRTESAPRPHSSEKSLNLHPLNFTFPSCRTSSSFLR